MATISVERNRVPLKAFLRADPYSQLFQYRDNSEKLVTPEMFWDASDGIYLDYKKIQCKSIQISQGMSQKQSRCRTRRNEECDEWIEHHMGHPRCSKLFVVEGYAGCGKTTFVQYLIRVYHSTHNYHYVDVGEKWSYPEEPSLFFNQSLQALCDIVAKIEALSPRKAKKVWKKFFDLTEAPEAAALGAEVVTAARKLSELKASSEKRKLISNIDIRFHDDYMRVQPEQDSGRLWVSEGQTQIVLCLINLLKCAEFCACAKNHENPENYSIFFDNLDVITDPSIPAENALLLWDVISRYTKFQQDFCSRTRLKLPNILFYITVRKVLYSHITSHLPDLEMDIAYNPEYVTICDISHLYPSHSILAHRLSYWQRRNGMNKDALETLLHVQPIVEVPDENALFGDDEKDYMPRQYLYLDALVNHNFRAFSNALSILLDHPKGYASLIAHDLDSNKKDEWKKVATLTFLLSLLYRKHDIWCDMGFGCKDYSVIDYPTTLNRLLLNYLYLARHGNQLQLSKYIRSNIPEKSSITLKEIMETFDHIGIMPINVSTPKCDLENFNPSSSQVADLVLERLADMCARSPGPSSSAANGYDADDDELWRRPLYFTGGLSLRHTATSRTEFKEYFAKAIEQQGAQRISFSITDEGCMLIKDIVANFEFYSGRYCDDAMEKPLHQATTKEELDKLILPVYEVIQQCCERNIHFMEQFMINHSMSKNDYLQRPFHPRTKPRYKKNSGPIRKLTSTSFRPQLHIVRAIYTHIGYFDSIKEYVWRSDYAEKDSMCECLTNWIKEYLDLYETYFFERLKETICNPDNNVYVALRKQVKKQLKQYESTADRQNILIRV